jgi:hypothetical protein
MGLNKVVSINLLLEKASRIAANLDPERGAMESKAEIDLLSLLFQIQSKIISIRAERCFKEMVAGSGNSTENGSPDEGDTEIILLDRRHLEKDRRELPTFIADDRRAGFADRRTKKVI